jgi:hypothetical protein
MARRLTSSERSARRRERESERARVARRREIERAAERARIGRAKECARRAREAERERREREAAQEKRVQIEAKKSLVEDFNDYVEGLASLHHRLIPVDKWRAAYQSRAEPRGYEPNTMTPMVLPDRQYPARDFPGVSFEKSAIRAKVQPRLMAYAIVAGVLGAALVAGLSPDNSIRLLCGLVVAWVASTVNELNKARADFKDDDNRRRQIHERIEAYRQAGFDQIAVERREAFERLEAERSRLLSEEDNKLAADADAMEQRRIDILADANEGDRTAIEMILEAMLPATVPLEAPDDFATDDLSDHEIGYAVVDGATIHLALRLPNLGVVPDHRVEMTPSGEKVRNKEFPDRTRKELYDQFAASFSLWYVAEVLKAYPFAKEIVIEASLHQHHKATGKLYDYVIVQARLPVAKLVDTDFRRVQAVDFIEHLGGLTQSIAKQGESIPSLIDRSQFHWAVEDDTDPEVLLVKPEMPTMKRRNSHAEVDEPTRCTVLASIDADASAAFAARYDEPLVNAGVAGKLPTTMPIVLGAGGLAVLFCWSLALYAKAEFGKKHAAPGSSDSVPARSEQR